MELKKLEPLPQFTLPTVCLLCPPSFHPAIDLSLSHINHPDLGSQMIPSSRLPKGGQSSPGANPCSKSCSLSSPRASWTSTFSARISSHQDVWAAAWRDFKSTDFGLIKSKSISHVSIPPCSEQNPPWLHRGQAQPLCSFSPESHTCHSSFLARVNEPLLP